MKRKKTTAKSNDTTTKSKPRKKRDTSGNPIATLHIMILILFIMIVLLGFGARF